MQKTLYLYHWKHSMVPIYICPLTHVLILDASIINTYSEIIDCPWLENIFENKHDVCLLYNYVSASEIT